MSIGAAIGLAVLAGSLAGCALASCALALATLLTVTISTLTIGHFYIIYCDFLTDLLRSCPHMNNCQIG